MKIWIINFVVCMLLASIGSAANLDMPSKLINSGGNTGTSTSYQFYYSIGEAAAGQAYGATTSAQIGFLNDYFIAAPTPTVTPTVSTTPTVTITTTPIIQFGGELLDLKYVYPAPHPIRGPYAHIYYHLAESAHVKIKVFTTSNKLVIAKEFGLQPAGKNYWQWHVANLANGPYLMLITAEKGSKKTRLIKKIAIIK